MSTSTESPSSSGSAGPEKLYNTRQAAEIFGVTIYTMREWLRTGVIKGIKIGETKKHWRIPESELTKAAKEKFGA